MEKLVKLYIDCPAWERPIKVDDFAVAVGKLKSNSVYHVAKVRSAPNLKKRIVRYHIECYKSDLLTCLKRDSDQGLIIVKWYSRDKKK